MQEESSGDRAAVLDATILRVTFSITLVRSWLYKEVGDV